MNSTPPLRFRRPGDEMRTFWRRERTLRHFRVRVTFGSSAGFVAPASCASSEIRITLFSLPGGGAEVS